MVKKNVKLHIVVVTMQKVVFCAFRNAQFALYRHIIARVGKILLGGKNEATRLKAVSRSPGYCKTLNARC